jgi:hypothetical protein
LLGAERSLGTYRAFLKLYSKRRQRDRISKSADEMQVEPMHLEEWGKLSDDTFEVDGSWVCKKASGGMAKKGECRSKKCKGVHA